MIVLIFGISLTVSSADFDDYVNRMTPLLDKRYLSIVLKSEKDLVELFNVPNLVLASGYSLVRLENAIYITLHHLYIGNKFIETIVESPSSSEIENFHGWLAANGIAGTCKQYIVHI